MSVLEFNALYPGYEVVIKNKQELEEDIEHGRQQYEEAMNIKRQCYKERAKNKKHCEQIEEMKEELNRLRLEKEEDDMLLEYLKEKLQFLGEFRIF
mmetsp:Transcript_27425/g.30545  ORF Transcript_27425/g.30545 Transcript_27425/m.30545 type:complete len:96 (-) Transcript_27425:91-378(-)